MKLSIFTTVTRPEQRGDNVADALKCYNELADEVIVIDGKDTWPQQFSWNLIGQHFQKGYEQATGDWVIHADLDFLFHERDFEAIRQACVFNNGEPALSFWKYQFILPDRYNLKSRLVIAVNKGMYGDRIRFDSGGDLCQPSLDGIYITTGQIPEARVPFYCYEKMTKTKEQVEDDVKRMADAWYRYFLHYKLGTNKTAYREWLRMVVGRFKKPQQHILLHEHPTYVQETIKTLEPTQWGWSGFDNLPINDYAKEKEKSK